MAKKLQLMARILLGLIYFIFGGMGLAMVLGLMKMPEQPMPEAAATFMTGILATKYFLPVLKITETFGGLLLLINFTAPLALVILAPVTIQIFLFNIFLMPAGGSLVLPVFMVFSHLFAASAYWQLYQPLFGLKNK